LHSSVPVINGLSDFFHPCQILADLMTIQECKGRLSKLRVGWLGDGDNVCNDLLVGCSKMGLDIAIACPKEYRPLRTALVIATSESAKSGSKIVLTEDAAVAVKSADVVVTDTFVSIGKEEEHL